MINKQILQLVRTNKGNNLLDLSYQSPVLLVFFAAFWVCLLQGIHDGYCKEKINFEKDGVHVVMVHMADYNVAEEYMNAFSLHDIEHISDVECKVYATFGLVKGSFSQLFGLKTWIRGFEIAVTKQMIPSNKRVGDGFQMPGVFLLKDGVVQASFIHNSVADKPDYEGLIKSCSI
ncbi:MAG: AhpC/TSA family protein [Saprospiraceae bacterium]|nr:AhpC/TSA family protein [Saprospiraceae bacterium]